MRKGSKKYLRAIVRSLINILRLHKDVINARLALRDTKLVGLNEAIKLYYDVAKGWLTTVIKKPLISIVSDPTLNFDFTDETVHPSERE